MSKTNIQFESLCYYKEGDECFIENSGFKDLYKSHGIFAKYNIRGRTINKTTFAIGSNDSKMIASIFTDIFGTIITPEKVNQNEKKKSQQQPTIQPILKTPISSSAAAKSNNFSKSLFYYRKDGECFIENPKFKELFKSHNIFEKYKIRGRTINKNTFAIQTIDSKILSSIFSDIYNTKITPNEIVQHENQQTSFEPTSPSPVLTSNQIQASTPTTKSFIESLCYYRKDGECFIENPKFKELFKSHNIFEKYKIRGRTINKNTFAIQTIDSKILSSIFSDIYNTKITPNEIDQHENQQTSKQSEAKPVLKAASSLLTQPLQNITQTHENDSKLKYRSCLLRVTEKFVNDVVMNGAEMSEEQVAGYPNVIGILKIDNLPICMYSNYCKNKLNIRYNLKFITVLSLEIFYDFVISNKISVREIFVNINNKLTQINDITHFNLIVYDMLNQEDKEIDEDDFDMAKMMFPNATKSSDATDYHPRKCKPLEIEELIAILHLRHEQIHKKYKMFEMKCTIIIKKNC